VLAAGLNDASSHISGDFDDRGDLVVITPITGRATFLKLGWGLERNAVSGCGGLGWREAIFFLTRGDQSIARCVINSNQVHSTEIVLRPIRLSDFLHVSLEANADEVSFGLFLELLFDLLKEAGPFVLLTLTLEVLPLVASLDLYLIDCEEIDAVPFQALCVVGMGHQV